MNRTIAILATVIVLLLVNGAIYQKEQHLAHGREVYLELAPVDPRSLMQGDYMALRFAIGNRIQAALRQQGEADTARLEPGSGQVIVQLDDNNVAQFQRLDRGKEVLADDEMRLHYRVRQGRVKFATNAFFFQEGHAKRYQPARYGQFRVNRKGEPLLVAMYDGDLNRLGEQQAAHK